MKTYFTRLQKRRFLHAVFTVLRLLNHRLSIFFFCKIRHSFLVAILLSCAVETLNLKMILKYRGRMLSWK